MDHSEMRGDSYPSKIEAVRIPACTERNITVQITLCVKVAGLDEKVKGFIIEFVSDAPQIPGKLGPPAAMPVVDALIDPLGVVKDSKEINNNSGK